MLARIACSSCGAGFRFPSTVAECVVIIHHSNATHTNQVRPVAHG